MYFSLHLHIPWGCIFKHLFALFFSSNKFIGDKSFSYLLNSFILGYIFTRKRLGEDIMLKFGIIVGSLRKESYNMKIAEYIVRRYKDKADFEIVDIKDFPLFNQDLEDDVPKPVLAARKKIDEKDGVIIVSPEHNHSIPGVMQNALDWFSRDDYVMMKKPYLLMGASDGTIGTARMQAQIKQVLSSGAFQMYSPPYNQLLFARIQDNMDEDGNITNEGSIERLDKKIDDFIDFTTMIKDYKNKN